MIVTVTPNPSLDRTLEVPDLVRGAVLRASGGRVDPGGKGVNVSRALAAHGIATCAVLPAGGAEGAQLVDLLSAAGVGVSLVPVTGATRANVSVVEPDGTVTKLNESGPALTAAELDQVVKAAVAAVDDEAATWLVVSGSLPPGAPADWCGRLVRRLTGHRVRVAVDSSGAPLVQALAARPHLVKPNREELAEATGLPVTTVGEAARAARVLLDRGAHAVLASLGADGALLLQADGCWYGRAPVASPVSSVGAGDATLAGFLAGGGEGAAALAEALAWGAAAVSLPGSRMPTSSELDRSVVHVGPLPRPDLVLEGPAA